MLSAEDSSLVGIDVGIRDFACLSNKTKIGHPHVSEKWFKKLAWEQRKLARKKKFSKRWKKQAKRVINFHHHSQKPRCGGGRFEK